MRRLCLIAAFVTAAAAAAFSAAPPDELSRLSRAYIASGAEKDRARLAAYARGAPKTRRPPAYFALGMGDHLAERYDSAAEALERARGLWPLGDYALYYLGHSLAREERHQAAYQALREFSRKYPNSRLTPAAERVRLESLIRDKRFDRARELLRPDAAKASEPVRLYLLGRVQELTKNPLNAVKAYRRVYYFHPFSQEAEQAEQRLNELRRGLGKRYPEAEAKWRLARAETLFQAGKNAAAAAEYRRAWPGLEGVERERARVRYAAANYRRIHTTAAYGWLAKLKLKDAELEAERLYYLGQCARRKGRIAEFERLAERLARARPRSGWYEEALFSLGNYYLLENDPRRSRRWYERTSREFPDGKHAAAAHWKLCWRAWLDDDPRTRALLVEHLTRYPASPQASAALYWLGRLYQRERDAGEAGALYSEIVARFPQHYYAYLARGRLRETGPGLGPEQTAVRQLLKGLSARRELIQTPSRETVRLLERGKLLFALGLEGAAERELATGDRRAADGHLLGIELARQTAERGLYYRALRYMKRYGYGYLRFPLDGAPREFWERLYPLPWEKELRRRAAPHKLDPYLVAAVIRQESEFNPAAVSRAGAVGLMQIMPRTGRTLARRLGLRGYSTRSLRNPDTSLRLGTFHLKEAMRKRPGKLEQSLAAYNAGESRVEEWITWGDFREPAEFVETIPFSETRGYVQAVIRNRDLYRRLYGGKRSKTRLSGG